MAVSNTAIFATNFDDKLSNSYVSTIMYEGKEYQTAEHLYQSLRYLRTGKEIDAEYAEMIRIISRAHGANILGEQYTKKGPAWRETLNEIIRSFQERGLSKTPSLDKYSSDNVSVECMQIALREKFKQITECRETLLATKGNIQYYSNNDFWGIKDTRIWGKGCNAWREFQGRNIIGSILKEIRDSL